MTSLLDEALAVGGRLPEAPGCTGVVELTVGAAVVRLRFADGRLVSASPGAPADAASEAPDVTLTLPATEAAAVLAGQTTPTVAFMQGRLKTAGDPGLVLAVLAATDGEPLAAWAATVRDPTR